MFSVYWFSSFWCTALVSIFSIAQPYVSPDVGPVTKAVIVLQAIKRTDAIVKVSRLVELFPVGWDGGWYCRSCSLPGTLSSRVDCGTNEVSFRRSLLLVTTLISCACSEPLLMDSFLGGLTRSCSRGFVWGTYNRISTQLSSKNGEQSFVDQ